MITGVNNIELIPPFSGSVSISDRITKLFKEAESVRAAIAFWTLSARKLIDIAGFNAYQVLRNEESFLCVDIQFPTNIDHLADLVQKGVSIYLNIRRIPKEYAKLSSSVGLLHTKILLADKGGDEAEFWIGSHNWTQFALLGPNIEASLILNLYNKAPLYRLAQELLRDIRDNYCTKFELDKVDYYKELQKKLSSIESRKEVIELEGNNVENLQGEVICIFGTENRDSEAVSTVGQNILVSIHDSQYENVKYLYDAEILQTGRLKAYDPAAGGIEMTESYRYAFTKRRQFPFLKIEQAIQKEVYDMAVFFAKLKLQEQKSDQYSILDLPRIIKPLWVEAEYDPIEERIKKEDFSLGRKAKPIILVPVDDERAVKQDLKELHDIKELSLTEKRTAMNYNLVGKKVIKYKNRKNY